MPQFTLTLRGSGEVLIEAHGVGDAQAQTEKELGRALPGASIDIREIRRTEDEPRIVETFALAYRVAMTVEQSGVDGEAVRRAVLRDLRAALSSTRFRRLAWDRVDVRTLDGISGRGTAGKAPGDSSDQRA